MERLLVVGMDTLVGSNLAQALRDRLEVQGIGLHGECHVDEVESMVAGWQPHWIVHCGLLTASSWDTPADAHAGQHEPHLASRLTDLAEQYCCRLTVVSSDVVFRGPRMFHEEGAPATNPAPAADWVRNLERAASGRDVLVVRTHVYGWSVEPAGPGFAERAFDALVRGTALPASFLEGRRHATPILATDLAELLWRAYQCHLHGLYHLAGTERTSPHRFVCELAAALGLPLTSAAPETGAATGSPCDETSLSSKLARRALAAATPILRDGIDRFVAQAYDGWRDGLRQAATPRSVQAVAA